MKKYLSKFGDWLSDLFVDVFIGEEFSRIWVLPLISLIVLIGFYSTILIAALKIILNWVE